MKSTNLEQDANSPTSRGRMGTGDSSSKKTRSAGRKPRPWKKALFALVAIGLFFGGVELLLGLFFWLSSPAEQSMLASTDRAELRPTSDYPATPDEYTKIAVFGGSAATGAYAWRAFDKFIEFELHDRFPNRKFYIKNYAQGGYPFHRHQAEHAKLLIKKYDFILIYCGNNEAENWFDESGYWRVPEYKDAKELVYQRPRDADPPLLDGLRIALEEHSHIYSLVKAAKGKFNEIELPPNRNRNFDYDEFEDADAVPPEEKKRIVSNFEKDVIEICKLAKQYDKQVLISVSATLETWPPCFSYFRQDISAHEKSRWQKLYKRGLSEYGKRDYGAAVSSFQKARKIDSGVAILNHYLGMSYLKQGDPVRGRRHLRQAIDQDGYYSRSITPLHRKAKELSKQYDRLWYVDTVAAFHRVMEGEVNDNDLFTDICHPSFLGQAIIGNMFVNQLLDLEPFRSWSPSPGRDVAKTNWKALADSYFEEFRITNAQQAGEVVGHILWYFDMAHWTAYPQRCYGALPELIEHFEEKADGSPSARVFAKVSRGRLAVAVKDYSLAVRMLNEAFEIAPASVYHELNMAAWSHSVASEFESAGIEFSREQGKFVMTR